MRLPIGLLTVPTAATGATGISGIHQIHLHARPGRLVGEELTQLEEGPRVPLVAMFVTDRYPLSDSRQIFKSQCLARYGG
ncbi:MAG TPA: hypothetical protein VGP82_24665, partial [Ktedonobacterales bacterium]|nr:hypothetical protein [Ktedonobacterales bacterium]